MNGQESFSYPGSPGLSVPQPKPTTQIDKPAALSQIAASIDQTGTPDVPSGVLAAFAGKLEGDYYIYKLGGLPNGDQGELVYMLKKGTDGWQATPICRQAWSWVWPGTAQQANDPVLVCAYIVGSGANLHLAAYEAGREVLRVDGLQDSSVQVLADPNGGVPTIVAYGSQQWLDHKAEPRVMERYVFTWQNDSYVLARHERRADWVYHLARLIAFVASGTPERAAAEFVTPPPEGVQRYIDRQAPDLQTAAAERLTTAGTFSASEGGPGRAYLRPANTETGRWFAFDYDKQGLIKAVSEQAQPPK